MRMVLLAASFGLLWVGIGLIGFEAWVIYNRAYNGEAAWECLHDPACLQRALKQLP